MPVNPDKWLIHDRTLNLWCTSYNITLGGSQWGNSSGGVEFETEAEANAAVSQWQLGEQTRYGGDRPPTPPKNP